MKKKVFLLIWSWLYIVINMTAAEELIARVYEWPPFYFQYNNKWTGSNVDALNALAKEAKLTIKLETLPWSRAMNYMKTKPIIIGYLTPTDKRREVMYFIGPHAREKMVLLVNKKHVNISINNLDDLLAFAKKTGLKVAYQKNVYYSKEFHERLEKDVEFEKYFDKKVSYKTALDMLVHGRLCGIIDVKEISIYKLKTYQNRESLAIHPFIFSSNDVYFGVSKTIPKENLKMLQEANKRLLANGTYDRITKKWENWFQN